MSEVPAGSLIHPDTAREHFPQLCKEAGLEYNYLTQPCREAAPDVCPVCSRPVEGEHGHLVCRSGLCHYRVLEGCCGD